MQTPGIQGQIARTLPGVIAGSPIMLGGLVPHKYDPKVQEVLDTTAHQYKVGFNPRTGEYVDMLKAGIIDPTKVTRLALENAASVAGTMLITECVITNIKNEDEQSAGVDPSMFM